MAQRDSDRESPTGDERATRAKLLRHRQFRIVLSARTVSWFGDAFIPVALPFTVLAMGGGIDDIGVVLGLTTVATVSSTLWGGVIGDGFPRRRILMTSDLVQGTLMLLTAGLLWSGSLQIWSLAVLMAMFGLATGVAYPTFSGLVPQVVDADDLQATNGLLSISQSVAQVTGPGLAGVLVAAGSPELALGVNAITFFVSASLLSRLKIAGADRANNTPVHLLNDLRTGWGELKVRRWYWVSILAHGGWNFGFATYFVLGPVISHEHLGGPGAWSAAGVALALGSIVGGILLLRVTVRRPVATANALLPLGALALLTLVGPAPLPVFVLSVALMGLAMAGANGAWNATAQRILPERVLSRLSSYDWLVSLAIMPLAYGLAGPLSSWLGIDALLWIAAVMMVVPCTLTLLDPEVRAVRRAEDGELVGPHPLGAAYR